VLAAAAPDASLVPFEGDAAVVLHSGYRLQYICFLCNKLILPCACRRIHVRRAPLTRAPRQPRTRARRRGSPRRWRRRRIAYYY
jgi:hypothetical protein